MRVVAIFGKFLISVGFGVLLFVAWTLWGTGIYESRAQQALAAELDRTEIPVAQRGEDEPLDVDFEPGPGRPVFRLQIPKIDLNKVVVEGVGTEELQAGPGHYPSCREGFERPLCTEFEEVWPGEKGRVVISGHRTTYGQPFFDLDRVEKGDDIITKTHWGEFTYEVTRVEIVEPDSLAIVIPSRRSEIVLTTCNPRYSAAQRLIVFAELTESA